MPTIARLIGGAGTGKTTRLLEIMERAIEAGDIGPEQVGFVSFTRAARHVAAARAAERFGVSVPLLEQEGWFRTLHSVCFKCLGCSKGDILSGDKESSAWLEEALGQPIKTPQGDEEASFAESAIVADTEAGAALGLWQAARNRLEPLAEAWARAEACDDRTPDLESCRRIIERYEQAKRLAGRSDFVDILGRFAGYRFGVDGHDRKAPDGYVPGVPVWFFDEQQDTSRLLDAVCHRLIEPSRWVYVVGDPFQGIYTWAGAEPRLFMAWEVAKEDIMPKSYRCPREILELGEDVLRDCSDYFDRGIAPADHEGGVDTAMLTGSLFDDMDPRESWLVLARSNAHAKRLSAFLDRRGLPWLPTKGNNRWTAPKTRAAIMSLYGLEKYGVIGGEDWPTMLDKVPSSLEGNTLLVRGTKTRFDQPGEFSAIRNRVFRRDDLHELGATDHLIDLLASGRWRGVVDDADRWIGAVEQWGYEAVEKPNIRLGTVHSVKGAEADNVLWLTSTSQQTDRAMETQDGADAERRVSYVAVTRARKKLIVVKERSRYAAEVPV